MSATSCSPARYVQLLLMAISLCPTACATWPPPSESHDLRAVAGETHLGEQADIVCTRVRTCEIEGLQVAVTPRCHSLSPLRFRVEIRAPESNALDTLLDFPVNASVDADQDHRQFIPLFMTPAEGATVWIRVSGACDNRKDQIWASTNCRYSHDGK